MECVLQWLDDLDDLVGAVALRAESLRRIALGCLAGAAALMLLAAAILAATRYPDVAPAIAAILLAAFASRQSAGTRRQGAALRG